METETRQIWLRVGVVIDGSKEEIEKVINGEQEALQAALDAGHFYFSGHAYLPLEEIEEYNEEYGEDIEPLDRDFDL